MKEINGNGKNMYYLGILSAIFNIDANQLETEIKQTFKKLKPEILDRNLTIFKEGQDYASNGFELNKQTIEIESLSSSETTEKILRWKHGISQWNY